jgi:Asp-tRNA(Asn)/Glu-tRNA(Gln) amidotransferase A subunit family amidase
MQSVVQIVDAVKEGRIAPRDAVASSMDAIARLDGEIGAFAATADREAALASVNPGGPLAGIAVGVKDIFDTHDLPTAYGSAIYEGHRPASDAAIVSMVRAAGGSIAGKTVTTEFAFLTPAGTRNPRNRAHTPGGSSSGSAAAVAAGMIPAAIGTQTGGSVIRPAAFCGVAGYKPSFRLLPATGMKTFSWSLDTVGLFAAGVADVARFAAGLTGRRLDVEPVEPEELRIGFYRSAVAGEASGDMQAAVARAVRLAADAGAQVIEVDEPAELTHARIAHATIQDFEAGLALADDWMRHGERMSEKLRSTIAGGRAIAPEAYDAARGLAKRARARATELFGSLDVLIEPSAPGAAPEGLGSTGSPIFNKLWTLTGNPSVNVPGLSDRAGMPLGVQVIARFGRDRTALSVGAWLQSVIAASETGT